MQNRLRRFAGQVGLSPENCRRVQAACVQAAALFGSELWSKGDGAHGTKNRQEDVQKVINQEARAHTGSLPDNQPRSPQPGSRAIPGKATKPTWAGARKPTTQNAQQLRGPSEQRHPEAMRLTPSPSSRTPGGHLGYDL